MVEISRPWGGIALGDAGPYTDENWHEVWRSIMGSADNEGVAPDELNELVVTGAVSPMSVDTGRAFVHGTWYETDAAVSVAIASPAVSTRVDLVVLQKVWATQTVRVALHAGIEGAGAPALTQSDGVTWEIPLAQASITTGGAITLTDTRASMAGTVPRGAIMLFVAACPFGWSEYTTARGRYVVGTPSGGTDEGIVGTVLSDLENRPAGQHTHIFTGAALGTHTHTFTGDALATHGHAVTDPGHVHAQDERTDVDVTGGDNAWHDGGASQGQTTDSNTTGLTVDSASGGTPSGANAAVSAGTPAGTNAVPAGSVAGTNAPYVQLRYCQKD